MDTHQLCFIIQQQKACQCYKQRTSFNNNINTKHSKFIIYLPKGLGCRLFMIVVRTHKFNECHVIKIKIKLTNKKCDFIRARFSRMWGSVTHLLCKAVCCFFFSLIRNYNENHFNVSFFM